MFPAKVRDMSWNFEKRIAHIDRRVSPLQMRGLRLRLLAAKVAARRGKITSLPGEIVLSEISKRVRFGCNPDGSIAQAVLRFKLRERRRSQNAAALRMRRPRLTDTRIFRAERIQKWLRQVQVDGDRG